MLRNLLLIKRRNFLLGLISILYLKIHTRFFATPPSLAASPPETLARDFEVEGDRDLPERASRKGLLFGAYPEGGYAAISQDGDFRSALKQECNLLVGGFSWWWSYRTPENFDFTEMDALHEFAMDRDMQFQGGALLWHQFYPSWLADKLEDDQTSTQELEEILVRYLTTAITRYKNKVHSWIVLNEAIEPKDGRDDGLRITRWLERLGPNYIDLAFRTAAAANPNMQLVYNDGMEYDDTAEAEAKNTALLKFLERLKSNDVPINALGIQSHLSGHRNYSNVKGLRSFLKNVADLGLKIFITELDVADNLLSADVEDRDRAVAKVYEDYLNVILDEPAVTAVISWGLTDRYTWLSTQEPRADGLSVRPLPLDQNMNRKLAWNAIARAIDACPSRDA